MAGDCPLCARMMEGVNAAEAMGAEVFWSMMGTMVRGHNLNRPGLGPRVRTGSAPVATKGQAEPVKKGFWRGADVEMKRLMERDKKIVLEL